MERNEQVKVIPKGDGKGETVNDRIFEKFPNAKKLDPAMREYLEYIKDALQSSFNKKIDNMHSKLGQQVVEINKGVNEVLKENRKLLNKNGELMAKNRLLRLGCYFALILFGGFIENATSIFKFIVQKAAFLAFL